ncbi:hypothetical protein J6590_025623 [Homalodisca vitripennis]|nr:hypothetical protein J6590_025623 [Homalodisca vitripennis]
MSNFGLNLDLSLYFEDQRRYSCVFVDSTKCKDVGDVEKHIKSVFTLEESICLSNKKFLIPSCEDIRILQQYETVIVKKREFPQTHPSKSTDTVCQHLALDLVQPEKTIDLSCRPKQRFKVNLCRSHSSGAEIPTFVKKCELYVPRLRVSTSQSNVIQTQQEEKQKKKSHVKRNEGRSCDHETNDDILDMSIQPVMQGIENGTSQSEESENAMVLSPTFFSINEIRGENELHSNESLKKSKKRKTPSEHVENLSTIMNGAWGFDNGNTVKDVKKPKKISKKSRLPEDFSITDSDVSMQKNEKEEPSNSTNFEDDSIIHKPKKSKKSDKGKDFGQNIDYNVSKSNRTVDCNGSVSTFSQNGHSGEENRLLKDAIKIEKPDQPTSECFKELTSLSKFLIGDIKDSNGPQKLNTGGCENVKSCDISSNSIEESESATPDIEHGTACEGSEKRRKRIRKHNKKKKKEKLELMNAVGSVLNRLNEQPQVTLPLASTPKHFFFTDADASELEIPVASQNITSTQEDKVPVAVKKEKDSEPSLYEVMGRSQAEWQQGLLRLARSSSKPMIFHRSSPSTSSKELPERDSSSTVTEEAKGNSASPPRHVDKIKKEREEVGDTSDKENIKKCNGEILSDTTINPNSDADTNVTERKKLEECNDTKINVQNIIIDNYPIINKINRQDLILFKVLKLNENREPEISRTILGKVNNCSSYPEKISFEIFDGSSECGDAFAKTAEGLVELRWADMIEPRLFYP